MIACFRFLCACLWLAGAVWGEIAPGFTRRSVAIEGGRISYLERPGAGPALLLIPGSFVGAEDWAPVIATLNPGLRIVIVELRGHGGSWPPPANGSIAQFAGDVLRAADDAGLARFYAGGHSIGGMIAIELARSHRERLAGVIAIEGWTHHSAMREAFQGDNQNTLSAAQLARIQELRKPVMSLWSREQVARFAQIWKQWNGFEILESTSLPVLELWGDRGRTPPSRAQLHIPERPNIELRWIAGASHYLPMERPVEVARAVQRFMSPKDPARLLADASLLSDPANLPLAKGTHAMVFRGEPGESGFNLHSYLAFHEGRFWAMWSASRVHEEDPDQMLRYATSPDGIHWDKAGVLAADPDGPAAPARWIARGLFEYHGRLNALGALIESADYRKGPRRGLEQLAAHAL